MSSAKTKTKEGGMASLRILAEPDSETETTIADMQCSGLEMNHNLGPNSLITFSDNSYSSSAYFSFEPYCIVHQVS